MRRRGHRLLIVLERESVVIRVAIRVPMEAVVVTVGCGGAGLSARSAAVRREDRAMTAEPELFVVVCGQVVRVQHRRSNALQMPIDGIE